MFLKVEIYMTERKKTPKDKIKIIYKLIKSRERNMWLKIKIGTRTNNN